LGVFCSGREASSYSSGRPNISRTLVNGPAAESAVEVPECCSCPSPFFPCRLQERRRMAHRYHAARQVDCASLLHGAPRRLTFLALSWPWLISALAASLVPVGPCPVKGLSGFMPSVANPQQSPRLQARSPGQHWSNRGGALLRMAKKLCVCVSDATAFMELLLTSFMGPGSRHHRRSLVTSVPCCMLDFEQGDGG
jgi:hypothetical protein